MNFLYFALCLVLGFSLLKYYKWLTDHTGRIYRVEIILGSGGTYTFWKIVGVVSIIAGFWILFNL